MRLLLMRHAQCHGNLERRMLGSQNGPTAHVSQATGGPARSSSVSGNPEGAASSQELTALGLRQAQALGNWLCQQAAPTHLYSSPLRRTRETCWQIQQHCSKAAALEPTSDRRLIEIDQGILTGLTWPEAREGYPQLCETLEQSMDWQPVPGAESPSGCRQRARALAASWLELHNNNDCLWVISHGGFLSHLVSELLGCDRTWGYAILPTALFELELDQFRWFQDNDNRFNPALWKIHRFNSTEHLTRIPLA